MSRDAWEFVLVTALAFNAALGFSYRVYRLTKGGPMSDVVGQAILGTLLLVFAVAYTLGVDWARWPALIYGLSFGLLVMPVWVLAVLIPLRPGAVDYSFTGIYSLGLAAIVVASIAL